MKISTLKPLVVAALMVALASACAQPGSASKTKEGVMVTSSMKEFSARDVISWAHLDDTLDGHVDLIEVGEADGQSILAGYVTVWNGKEMVEFVKAHGYQSFRGPLDVKKNGRQLEVKVEITGKDGKTLVITLLADGGMQGAG